MTKPNDGGSAFPMAVKPDSDGIYLFKPGMTLRAWLAGQALATIRLPFLAVPALEELTEAAVQIADAMIAELEKEKETEDETDDDAINDPDFAGGLRSAREQHEHELAEQVAQNIANAVGDAIDQSAAAGKADHDDGAG